MTEKHVFGWSTYQHVGKLLISCGFCRSGLLEADPRDEASHCLPTSTCSSRRARSRVPPQDVLGRSPLLMPQAVLPVGSSGPQHPKPGALISRGWVAHNHTHTHKGVHESPRMNVQPRPSHNIPKCCSSSVRKQNLHCPLSPPRGGTAVMPSWQHRRHSRRREAMSGEEELNTALPDCVRETTSPSLWMGNSCHQAAHYNPPSTVKGIERHCVK